MKKLTVVIGGQHSSSICLEEEFLAELKKISKIEKRSINKIVTEIDKNRKIKNLSSAVRLYILKKLQNRY